MQLTYRTTDETKWGTGKNSGLTNTEIDNNFYELFRDKFDKSGGTITGAVTVSGSGISYSGSTSGATTLRASAVAGSTTITMPAASGTLALTTDITAKTIGATIAGGNLLTLDNPNAIAFLRINADNTASALDAATFRTAIGAGTLSAESDTLATVTERGATTATAISITSTTWSTNPSTGALVVSGGVGIAGNVFVGDDYHQGAGTNSDLGNGQDVAFGIKTQKNSYVAVIQSDTGSAGLKLVGTSGGVGIITAEGSLGSNGSVSLFSPSANSAGGIECGQGPLAIRGAGQSLDYSYAPQDVIIYTNYSQPTLTITGSNKSVTIHSTLSSTSSTTGALLVSGGVGINGNVNSSGDVNAVNFNSTSDITFKKDLEKITDALNKVKQLTGYTYTLIDSNVRSTGLIAQDAIKVLPEVVSENEGKLSISYGSMMGLIVEAIKEIDEKLEDIRNLISNK